MGARLELLRTAGAAGPEPDLAPPSVVLDACTPAELRALVHSGENDSDACERLLAQSTRVETALDLALAEGLLALTKGDRLIALGFSKLGDYTREVLDLSERSAEALVQLARELPLRPRLRQALHAGELGMRHARTILPVAIGAAEAGWVERARTDTVRALEAAVRREREGGEHEEEWRRLRVHLSPEDRAAVDEALARAGSLHPGSSRAQRLEAMAQEYLGGHALHAPLDDGGPGGAFRPSRETARTARLEARLEEETDRWACLAPLAEVPAPAVSFGPCDTELEIDARLRELALSRRGWDAVAGHCALMVKRSGLWRIAGFASFAHYCRERLRLAPRTVEQRAALERRLWQAPALRAARDAGLSYERLRLLARLPDRELASWIPRARELTVVELRAALAGEDETQMRAARILRVRVPERVASLLQAAFRTVRAREGKLLCDGRCLVALARHFLEAWPEQVKRARTRSQKIRERDGCRCQVPGCSRRAVHAHHVVRRSRGGSDDPDNLVSLCAFHHLRGVHEGYLRVRGHAPGALVWEVGPLHAPVDLRARCLAGLPGAAAGVSRAA